MSDHTLDMTDDWPIIWGNLYSKRPFKRVHCEARIRRHCELTGLLMDMIGWAVLRQVVFSPHLHSDKFVSRAPWHSESGNDPLRRGHLTVDYKTFDGGHLTTAHIYHCDEAYFGL